MQLLLATCKVEADSKDMWGATPLSYTARDEQEAVV